ncbi:farnesol dehydrogenase-like [Culicoides brevitarsis]|uniref:farnesol dehydrogenase-like n=1 Tax=Culicoides brevitarsis TaxID=469753 RepID=UPI00307BCC40
MEKWIGKTAVVTGASAGIGASILCSLADHGINVIGLARRKTPIEALAKQNAGKGKILALSCDVSDPKSIEAVFRYIERNIGPIHIWINNAGIWRASKLTNEALRDDEVIATINTNLTGLVLCSRKAVRLMEKNDEPGYLININSVAGMLSASNTLAEMGTNVYAGTKHAAANITEILRIELAAKSHNKIRVSNISPGIVYTDIFIKAGMSKELRDKLVGLKPEDIADSVIYLLSTPLSVNVSELTIRPSKSVY